MNNKVIYTCLVGNYDELLQPKIIHNDFDYICFSNEIAVNKIGVWQIRKIPFYHKDKTRLSRFVKLNPHKVLPEYEYSIWIDANILIEDNTLYNRVFELIKSNSIIAQISHTFINCIYDDIIKSIILDKEKIILLIKHYKFLKKEGYPMNWGLYENGLIFRKHNNNKIITISNKWWETYIMSNSKRDQHSLCYVYWKLNFKPELLFPKGMDVRNLNGFVYKPHLMTFKQKVMFKFKNYRNRVLILFLKPLFLKK